MQVFAAVFLVALALLNVSTIHAYDLDEEFKKADTNEDGKLSLEEMIAFFPDMERTAREEFARFDVNNDGYITLEEARSRKPGHGIFDAFLD